MIWRQSMSPLASFGIQPFQICQQAFKHKQMDCDLLLNVHSFQASIEDVRLCGIITLRQSTDGDFEVCIAMY
jgi:hypothetical protein